MLKNVLTILVASFLSIFLLQFFGCSNENLGDLEKEVVLRLEPQEGNPRNSEGDFLTLKDGRILFVYTHFTAGAGDNANAYLASRNSDDDGKTWTEEDITIVPNEGGMNVMSVSLIRLNSDKIALFYMRKNSETDCLPVMRISSDEATTWSEPIVCVDEPGYYVMNNDRAVKLNNGRIVLPLALHNTPDINEWFNGRIICYYSDDDGNSWIKGNEIANPKNVTSQEPGIIELKDERVMLFCRTNLGVQYFAYSDDNCETWSELEPGNIKSPLSPASIERIPQTGDLLLVWNNNYKPGSNGGKRTPFNLAISKDEGKTWIKSKTIESDPFGWYCYTAIEFIEDNILLAHCAGDTKLFGGLETTQITRLNLDWINLDATPAPYVQLNKNGIVELSCEETDATIYYSIDNNFPSLEANQIYSGPIRVEKTKILFMYALSDGKTSSDLISTFVGEDVLQPALKNVIITGPGLNYEYFNGEFSSTEEIKDVKLDKFGIVSNFSIPSKEMETNFALIYDGMIQIHEDGLFNFYIESNDGSVLFIDDEKVIDNDGSHKATEEMVSISLMKGMHKITLKYFQAGGGKKLKVYWSSKDFDKKKITDSLLFH
jgi:BNR repeat-like domain/PA14 domain/Chitobiase/beta-hexosaminidase C-terminal domain